MTKFKYIAFYKPFGVLTQFTGEEHDRTLAEFNLPPEVYAAGRLDKDSEGLLILTNDGIFNQKLTHPKSEKLKTYWAQVEREPTQEKLEALRKGGIKIKDYLTRPCQVKLIPEPILPERDPPIRYRKNIPTSWLELKLSEGKNRQVRRMTAAIGHPTLRLVRYAIGNMNLDNLSPGQWIEIKKEQII